MKYRFVFFDVDSTLVTIEGIDVLARGNPEVVRLTEAAMNGEIPLDQVYARRLDIIRPALQDVEALGARYIESLVDGAHETIAALHTAGVNVHLVTAGIAQAIAPLADHLKIRPANVHAVALKFDEEGRYADFDRRSMLARPGGKELVVRAVMTRSKGKAAFVGDGASDLETQGVVDLFIGFGGVAERAVVRDGADVYATTMGSVLSYLL